MPHSLPLCNLAVIIIAIIASATANPGKRGLCYVPNKLHPADNKIWVQPGSRLSWYYNYGSHPSAVFSKLSQSEFEFVPMMWGVSNRPEDPSFRRQIEDLIDDGVNITHVLGFNEPNAPASAGGSDISPKDAARAWVANFEPLANRGVKLGLPAMTGGPIGMLWLHQFLDNCSAILTGLDQRQRNCTWDFLPIHWYDNFDGLVSHIDERRAVWPNAKIWITEYAYAHRGHRLTRAFFNKTLEYFDNNDYIARYTYFGAFRPGASQVGSYAALLNEQGALNQMGVEYINVNKTQDNGSGEGRKAVVQWTSLFAGVAGSLAWIVLL